MKKFILTFAVLVLVSLIDSSAITTGQCDGENEEYNDCGSLCIATCQNRQFANCAPDCNPGCYCKTDYIRDEISGKCVKISDCPKS